MIPLYTEEEFKSAKSRDFLTLKCVRCSKIFKRKKHRVQDDLSKGGTHGNLCSWECQHKANRNRVEFKCTNCGKSGEKKFYECKRPNTFCTQSCAATYNNKNKSSGYRRSKYEIYAEKKIKEFYPELKFQANNRSKLGLELDLYFPDLNLAIEINGILHYKPIYGKSKFLKIIEIDKKKKKICREVGIKLEVINIAKYKTFEKFKKVFWNRLNKRILKYSKK